MIKKDNFIILFLILSVFSCKATQQTISSLHTKYITIYKINSTEEWDRLKRIANDLVSKTSINIVNKDILSLFDKVGRIQSNELFEVKNTLDTHFSKITNVFSDFCTVAIGLNVDLINKLNRSFNFDLLNYNSETNLLFLCYRLCKTIMNYKVKDDNIGENNFLAGPMAFILTFIMDPSSAKQFIKTFDLSQPSFQYKISVSNMKRNINELKKGASQNYPFYKEILKSFNNHSGYKKQLKTLKNAKSFDSIIKKAINTSFMLTQIKNDHDSSPETMQLLQELNPNFDLLNKNKKYTLQDPLIHSCKFSEIGFDIHRSLLLNLKNNKNYFIKNIAYIKCKLEPNKKHITRRNKKSYLRKKR